MRVPGIPFHQGRNDYTDADGLHFGIAIHNTSNTASDESESSYADHRTDGTSSHFYVDADSVIQSLDTNDKAGHAGSREGNDNALAFELTGTNDKSRAWWLANVAWARLGYVIAYILQHDPDYRGFQVRRASVAEMRQNPKVKAFYSHNDMRLAWGGTTHDDPGPGFPWDRLLAAVNAALNPAPLARKDEDDMGFDIADRTNVGVEGGAAWRDTALQITNDTGFGDPLAPDYALRIWAKPYGGAWVPIAADKCFAGGENVQPGGLVWLASGQTLSWALPHDTRTVSIRRMALDPGKHVQVPALPDADPKPVQQLYGGPLAGVLER